MTREPPSKEPPPIKTAAEIKAAAEAERNDIATDDELEPAFRNAEAQRPHLVEGAAPEKAFYVVAVRRGTRTTGMMMVIQLRGGGGGELRHLSYEDPPGVGVTEQEWRNLLAQAVYSAESEEEFVQMMVFALGKDLVLAHGCDPHVAIPAIIDFARKVYQEYSI